MKEGLRNEKGNAFVDGGGHSCSRHPYCNRHFRLAKSHRKSRGRTSNANPF
jgi:hypothetical protein